MTPQRDAQASVSDEKAPPVYCGCWQSKGHFVYLPGGKRSNDDGAGPWKYLDSQSLHPNAHGRARLTHLDGWTALGIGDRSVDERGGSHSTFAFPALLDFDQAVEAATRHFPEVMARIGLVVPEEGER